MPLQEECHGYDVCKPGIQRTSFRSCISINVQAPFFLPVLLDVVSKLSALIQFLTPHSDNTSIITTTIAWPVPDGNLGTERSCSVPDPEIIIESRSTLSSPVRSFMSFP